MVTRGDSAAKSKFLALLTQLCFVSQERVSVRASESGNPNFLISWANWVVDFIVSCHTNRRSSGLRVIGTNESASSFSWGCMWHKGGRVARGLWPDSDLVHLEVTRAELLPVAIHKQKGNKSPQIPFNCIVGVAEGDNVLYWNTSGFQQLWKDTALAVKSS